MQYKYVFAYLRLSNDDDDKNDESNSITNQRLLINYFVRNSDEFKDAEIIYFIDDGYSGTNFKRPGFREMMNKAKSVGTSCCIIVKDDCVIIEPTQKDLENQGFVAGSICF